MNKGCNPQKALGVAIKFEDFIDAGINSRKEMPNQGFKGVIQVGER